MASRSCPEAPDGPRGAMYRHDMTTTVCALHGCPNRAGETNAEYCQEHLGAGAIVDAIADLGGSLTRIEGLLDRATRRGGQLDEIARRVNAVARAVVESRE
jgi:hypothetical protein